MCLNNLDLWIFGCVGCQIYRLSMMYDFPHKAIMTMASEIPVVSLVFTDSLIVEFDARQTKEIFHVSGGVIASSSTWKVS
jgi:hypothetical protein